MKERFIATITIITVVFVVLAKLCKSSEQMPLCGNCDDERELPGQELPSFSSRYRALEYDETVMKLLMEMLLRQHNSFPEEDDAYNSDSEHSENSNSEVDGANQTFPTTEKFISDSFNNASQNNKPITTVISPELHGPSEGPFLHLHQKQFQSKDNNAGFQRKAISKTFEELSSIHETPQQLLSIVDSNDDNRFYSILSADAERINMKAYFEKGKQNSEKQVAAVTTTSTTTKQASNSSVSIRNILSSKYRDTKRTSKLDGAHSILLRPRPFDGFIETQPLPSSSLAIANYREHFKRPTIKPKKKINSLKSFDRDQDVRGEIQLEIINRPISAGKPMTTSPDGVGVGCENATGCSRPNNKKPINSIKVKIGHKPAKMTTKVTRTTTTERGIFGKPGIRFPKSKNPNSVASSSPVSAKPDGNLISARLASIVDRDDKNDAEDSDEEYRMDENGEYYDEKEDPDTSNAEYRKNFAFSKDQSTTTTTPNRG